MTSCLARYGEAGGRDEGRRAPTGQATGARPRVTVEVWLCPSVSVQATWTRSPASCLEIAFVSSSAVVATVPPSEVMVLPAVIPASAAAPPSTRPATTGAFEPL